MLQATFVTFFYSMYLVLYEKKNVFTLDVFFRLWFIFSVFLIFNYYIK